MKNDKKNRHPAAVRVPGGDGYRAPVHKLHGQLQGGAGLRLVLVPPHPASGGGAGAHGRGHNEVRHRLAERPVFV